MCKSLRYTNQPLPLIQEILKIKPEMNMIKKISFLLFFSSWIVIGAAQVQPSNIYLFKMIRINDTTYNFTEPKFLTQFNDGGYNNQPSFFDNYRLYITSQSFGQAQPDLFMLDLRNDTKYRITNTPEGEYSPNLMPTRYQFSAIRQEISARDTLLRLWQFPMDRLSNGKPIFKYLNNIGYYEWINSKNVAIFVVDNPNFLAIANTDTDKLEPVATGVGRCFKKLSNGNLAFVKKNDFDNDWAIMEKKLSSSRSSRYGRSSRSRVKIDDESEDETISKIIETLPGSEDFEVMRDGTILMGLGSRIFKFNRYRDEDWVEIADLKYFGIRNITRLELSADNKLAVVTN